MKQKFIIAGNWKMNPATPQEARGLMRAYRRDAVRYPKIEYRVCVPSVYLPILQSKTSDSVGLYAQNVYFEDQGAYTGALSFPMVRGVGAEGVLIGHSERRNIFGVSDEIVHKKIEAALEHDMPMIVCFGESNRDDSGEYTDTLKSQLTAILAPFVDSRKIKLLTLAYEPVWAIGADATRPVTQDELFSTAILIRNILKDTLGERRGNMVPLLYGGSVNVDNAAELSRTRGIQGFLIGRAGLEAESLRAISDNVQL